MSPDPASRAEIDHLVAAAVGGDRRAVGDLLKIIRPLVVRYCRPRIGSERAGATADDVAQEVCLAVLKALPTYQDQGRPFLAFVYGIAAHKVVDAHRAAGRDRSDPTDDMPEEHDLRDGPEQAALALSESAGMRELLDRLPPKQREILVLRVVVGLSAEETAEAVGSTAGAVRVAQHRAVSKLRQLLGEQAGDGTAGSEGSEGAGGAAPGRRPAARHRADAAADAAAAADVPVVDWDAAPRTGDPALDELLALAEAHIAATVPDGGRRAAMPTLVPDRRRALDEEHDRMARAAHALRRGPKP